MAIRLIMHKPDWRESRYLHSNYCSNCGLFIKKSKCVTKKGGKDNQPRIFCPDCHCRVRLHSRNRYWRNKKEKDKQLLLLIPR